MKTKISKKVKNKRPTYESGVLDKRPYAERTEIFPIKRPKDKELKREVELGIGYDE